MSSPSLSDFQTEIGACMARGDLAAAAAAAAGCRAAWPANAEGWLLGSIAALLAEQKETALALVEERIGFDPGNVQCLLQKAECLLALGSRAGALAAAEAAAASSQEFPAALDAVGQFLVYAGEHRRALDIYSRAVAAAPEDPAILANRAVVHRFVGNFDLAALDYDRVLALSPGDPEVLKARAGLRRQSQEGNSIAVMEAALAAATGSEDAIALHFGLAKSHEDLGNYAASWGHLSAGNTLERARIQYEPDTDRAAIERLIDGFPDVEAVRTDSTGERPIFIVGLPRTGTTLVERIIGNHSQVHSAGELAALSQSIGSVVNAGALQPGSWLDYAAALGGLDGVPIAREYLARTRVHRGDKPRFSDKQLTNFYYCALIFRAFPQARIVHLTRHPLAACHAIYKTRFRGAFPFAYDLIELGDFYIGYRRLMAHWRRILPARILDVAYEDVVTAQESTTRRLLEYLGLPFEAACLDPHLNPDAVRTASSVQVRQPIYTSSLQQWRHYAVELAPLRAQLEAAGIPID